MLQTQQQSKKSVSIHGRPHLAAENDRNKRMKSNEENKRRIKENQRRKQQWIMKIKKENENNKGRNISSSTSTLGNEEINDIKLGTAQQLATSVFMDFV